MEKIKNFGFWMLVLLAIYLLVCIFHLSWYIANPEGFWGIMHVIDILRVAFIITLFIAVSIFGVFLLFDQIWKTIKGQTKVISVLKGLGNALALGLILIFNSLFSLGTSYFLGSKMAEKYSYLEVSEDLIKSGKIEEANSFARKAYKRERDKEDGWVFFLTKLWTISDFNQKEKLLSKYEATVNYAYCQATISGNSNHAERLFNEALTILDKDLFSKDEKKDRAMFSFLSLSNIKFEQRQFAESERYFNRAFKTVEGFSKKDFEYISISYLLMIDRASKHGDWKRKNLLCNELLDKYEKSGMSLKSRNYLHLLQILVSTELLLGNKQEVSKLIHISNRIAKKYKGEEIFQNSQAIKVHYFLWLASIDEYDSSFDEKKGFLSRLFSSKDKPLTDKQKSIELAQNSLLEIVDLSIKPIGNYFTDLEIQNYYLYYRLLILRGETQQAYQTLKSISKYINPQSTFIIAKDILFLIALYESKQSPSKMNKMNDLEKEMFNNFYNQFALLNDIDRETLLLKFRKKINSINYQYIQNSDLRYTEHILNNSIKIKGLSLLSQRQINQYLNNLQNPKVKKYQNLAEEFRKLQNSSSLKNRTRFEEVRSELFALHQELDILKVITNGLKLNISWEDIRSKMGNDELAVEIIRVPNQDESEVIYYGLVFSSTSIKPALIKLFSEDEIESVLNCTGNTKERINCILETKLDKINELIFNPLSSYTKDKKVIYISKAGLLHALPLGSISIDKPWIIKNITSLQSILSDNINFTTNEVSLFGGAEFEGIGSSVRNSSSAVSLEVRDKLLNDKISNLKHSKNEVLEINNLYEQNGKVKNNIYLGIDANEVKFRALSGGKSDIMHVATHGFSEGLSYHVNSTFNSNNNAISELLRSGILLSPHQSTRELNDQNDGIITAMDLAQLDLSNYNLAIFSSCESGLGNLYGNQGVFGIVRGLKSAGVKSMIVSLWQVPDKQTSELMIAFYKYYLNGNRPNDALKKAKTEMKLTYPNPYFWAGFEYFE
jgi:CHAT domain-containing protein